MLQNVTLYRKTSPISATQPRKNEEATVTGSPQSDRGLGWNRIFAHSLLYGRGITLMTMGEFKI